ncbi:DUF4910 domain-containing protein [Pseudoalteromonas mariniglutinosa]|uniref:DUF4910 domain-containing protein n=1 Tax=Pseudoalteromonas mariniglutinosa TaxID=206042 RepID=UPI00384A72DA
MADRTFDYPNLGNEMYRWATDLYPICRSLTGQGVRETLNYLSQELTALKIMSVPSGTHVFDWTIPKEWAIEDAYLLDPNGQKVISFETSNLHVLNYSMPIDIELPLDELNNHLYSIPDMPTAIPYVTSYYAERWGFCLSQEQRDSLQDGLYRAVIKSQLFDGELNYGEFFIPGLTDKEVLISTYICHPSMANNELSGPVVTTALAKLIEQFPDRYYSYRFVFVPETIGAITFISENLAHLKAKLVAGFVLTCIGDDRNYSYLASREENTLADRVAKHVLYHHTKNNFKSFTFLDRGSDERQYCAPGVDLPVCSIMRTKYGEFPEYHTSLDDLNLISATGLAGGLEVVHKSVQLLESNKFYKVSVYCEPQLGKRGLYPTLSKMDEDYTDARTLINLITYCDGKRDLIGIAEKIGINALALIPTVDRLVSEGLLLSNEQAF